MVVRMSWMVLARKWMIVLVFFCILGTLTQACHDYEEEDKENIIDEEKVEPTQESGSKIIESKWFILLDKLIDRYPIIERIIERIFQWIFNYLLDFDY
jgi:hypothetical protein